MSKLHPSETSSLAHLLRRNQAWAARKVLADPAFFKRLSTQQRPSYFWIGCSDSRVPATEIVDLDPGEMFVHRNVANLAVAGDPNFEAALAYAVDVLCVEHVIVTGHYGCGGVLAARDLKDDELGRWLATPHALYRRRCGSETHRSSSNDRLCEFNVVDQVERLLKHPTITRAWQAGRRAPWIHGWIYSIANGLITELCAPIAPLPPKVSSHG
ncbi:MAG: carbonic anhydrase [Hyphomonadaceae bacterium]